MDLKVYENGGSKMPIEENSGSERQWKKMVVLNA